MAMQSSMRSCTDSVDIETRQGSQLGASFEEDIHSSIGSDAKRQTLDHERLEWRVHAVQVENASGSSGQPREYELRSTSSHGVPSGAFSLHLAKSEARLETEIKQLRPLR